jgi:predicted metalloendopeptidase
LVVLLAGVAVLAWARRNAVSTGAETANSTAPDSSIKPGDDFYHYANGPWLAAATIPSGKQSYDTRAIMATKTRDRVRNLIQDAAADHPSAGSITQKVGDYYASFLDEAAIESKGLSPLAGEMTKIAAIADRSSLSAYLGTTLNREVDGLTSNSDHVLGLWINQGFEDADHNLPHIWQGGLGLPDRENYLDASPKTAALRDQYQSHIAAVLKLAGDVEPEAKAARILSLETRIARSFAPDSDAADTFKQNNHWKRSDFASQAPGMDWNAYFQSAGLARQTDFEVWQPSAVIGISGMVQSESIDDWKAYLTFHLIEHYASVLPGAIRAEHFAFAKTPSGALPERGELAIDATNGALGEAVGQLYTQRYFPPEAKQKAQAMVHDLLAAYRQRISNLTWMSPTTKQKALAKLATLEIDVGYPDVWTDFSSLEIVRGDAFGNLRRAEAFYHQRDVARLSQPVQPIEWPMNAQVPGAVIMFSPNVEVFSAAILQSPYFDPQGDTASNYGSAGAGMAHEISHTFDELGNIYDDRGRLVHWWTGDDLAAFQKESAKLASQLDGYCPLAGLCLNGKQVLGESVADLAGLLVAHDAYLAALHGQPDAVLNGLSGEQRFFLAFAQRWRRAQTEAALRSQVATDTHPPGEYRADAVRNLDAWYNAYDVQPSQKLYLTPQSRIRIW